MLAFAPPHTEILDLPLNVYTKNWLKWQILVINGENICYQTHFEFYIPYGNKQENEHL